ncbi:hypothetical protein F4775DRAFT_575690 [Biscogniauxia sp. FL1348]|nr:hypothetical protein F4775DRAFT_575690 [Biscogniauxia sp. FL1348]
MERRIEDVMKLRLELDTMGNQAIGEFEGFPEDVNSEPATSEYFTLVDLEVDQSGYSIPYNESLFPLNPIPETSLIHDADNYFKHLFTTVQESQGVTPGEQEDSSSRTTLGGGADGGGSPVDLETLWTEPGADWKNVELSREERDTHGKNAYHLAACVTGPRCYSCDEPLEFEELLYSGCPVCYCFN